MTKQDNEKFSGQCDPLFLFPDGVSLGEVEAHKGVCAANAYSLVKDPKSPTRQKRLMQEAFEKQKFLFSSLKTKHCEISPERAVVETHEGTRVETPHGTAGASAVFEFREWSDEWRVRSQVELTQGIKPPEQSGERLSEFLSSRGAKKIAESCEFMALQKGGFKTFVTGTLSDDARAKIASGEITIQKEVSRTMDAMSKMYKRGWVTDEGTRIEGNQKDFAYCWVVEIPKNDKGEDNPHVHLMMNWHVDHKIFKAWAARLESMWGHGWFKLEKIKDSYCAGAYLAKAAGYMTKAQDDDTQGVVRGNRYGISESARAPNWVVMSKAQLHVMGQLIADIYDHLTVEHGEKYRQRAALNRMLEKTPKTKKAIKQKIGKRLASVRAEIKKIPVRCNKYQVIIKGKCAAVEFFNWLKNDTKTQNLVCPAWLPEKPEGCTYQEGAQVTAKDSHYFRRMRKKFENQKFWRRLKKIPKWINEACDTSSFWDVKKHNHEYNEWAEIFSQNNAQNYAADFYSQ